MKRNCDWNKIAKLNPRGFLSIQTAGDVVVHGPIEKISVDKKTNVVEIEVRWFIYGKGLEELSAESWVISKDSPFVVTKFLNGTIPFEIEESARGLRVIFSDSRIKVLYVNYFETIDLSEITGFKERILKT